MKPKGWRGESRRHSIAAKKGARKPSKKVVMYSRIAKHGENLKKIFKLPSYKDPVELCKKLRRLETKGNYIATQYANGDINFNEFHDGEQAILSRLDIILDYKRKKIPVIFNSDPRGYALKIDDDYVRRKNLQIERDWGGYGLIAPDLR